MVGERVCWLATMLRHWKCHCSSSMDDCEDALYTHTHRLDLPTLVTGNGLAACFIPLLVQFACGFWWHVERNHWYSVFIAMNKGYIFDLVSLLALYPGSWWVERKRAWYLLFVHVRNYLLQSTCSGKSGRGMRNTYPRNWYCDVQFSKHTSIVKCSEEWNNHITSWATPSLFAVSSC